ncbi:hypothetical protein Lal_00002262 [Lupinus albus]|nr:hypothetical protein Lal_00002262 [Lupinus albus]
MRLVSGSRTKHISRISSGRKICIVLLVINSSSSELFLLCCLLQNLSFIPYEKHSKAVSSVPQFGLYPLLSSLALDLLLPLESPCSSLVSAPTLHPPPRPYRVRHLKETPFPSSSSSSSSSDALLLLFLFLNFWLTLLTRRFDTLKL